MVAQALITSGGDSERFVRSLAWRLRLWFIALPAGVGMATLRACVRLWLGWPTSRSGVWSAGNGPAMRSAILGAAINDTDRLSALVRRSTRLTHRDPKAEYAARAVAIATRCAKRDEPVDGASYLDELRAACPEADASELLDLLERASRSALAGERTAAFADELGLSHGVSGYAYHTAPVCVHSWLSHPKDWSGAVQSVIECGGDADSTAAIVGGIVGSSVGPQGLPVHLMRRLSDWPRSTSWMTRLGEQLAGAEQNGEPAKAMRLPLLPLLLRNAVFLMTVLTHGFRRLAPPY